MNFVKQNYKLFPTLVTRYENFLNADQLQKIFEYCIAKQNQLNNHETFDGTGKSSHSDQSNILEEIQNNIPACSSLIKDLNKCLREYENDYGLKELELANSWFNVQNEGSVLLPHVHPGSVLSGAIYINADAKSSKMYFENPNRLVYYFRSLQDKFTEFSYENFYFQPIPGTVLIFPSWLSHGTFYDKNFSKERMVISFNSQYRMQV